MSCRARFSFSFTTRDASPPIVTQFIPPDGTSNLSFYTQPIAVFSHPMRPFGFLVESLNGLPPITLRATFDASGTRPTLQPRGVKYPSGSYRISIPETATDAYGIQIISRPTYTFTYQSDFSLPKLTTTIPTDDATSVELHPFVLAQYDHDLVKVGDYAVTLEIRTAEGVPVTGTVVSDDTQNVVYFGTLPTLDLGTRYIVTATQHYTEPSGNVLTDVRSWSFTTTSIPTH